MVVPQQGRRSAQSGRFRLRIGQVHRRRIIRPIGHQVDEPEDAFGPGHRDERLVVLVANDRDGGEKLVREQEKRDEAAHGHVAVKHPPAADQEQNRDKKLAVQLQQRGEDRRGAGQRDVKAGMIGQQTAEKAGVGFLADEALGYPDAVDRLSESGRDATEALL